MARNQHTTGWCRWLHSVGMMPTEIAAVLDLDPSEVDSHLHVRRVQKGPVRIPDYMHATGPLRHRSIRCQTAHHIVRLHELGYDVDRIARILVLRPRAITDFLARTEPTPKGQRVKPRTQAEQRRVESTRRRREQRRAHAAKVIADRASWMLADARRDDAGCKAPGPPAAAELLHQVDDVEPAHSPEDSPTPPNPWNGPSNPRAVYGARNGHAKLAWPDVREIRRRHSEGASCYALAREYGVADGTIRSIVRRETWRECDAPADSPPSTATAELPTGQPRARWRRWRPGSNEPRWGARGSGARHDDAGCVPLPAPVAPNCAAEVPAYGEWSGEVCPRGELHDDDVSATPPLPC